LSKAESSHLQQLETNSLRTTRSQSDQTQVSIPTQL
jgi:hypothetical protein